MSDARIIRSKLRKLLPTVDMDSATQRSIQKQLEDELGISLNNHKQMIKEEIDTFLLADDDEDGGSEYEPGDEADGQPPQKKQKQLAGGAVAAGGSDGPQGGHILKLSDKRFVTLSDYKGKWYVNVREYYDKEGVLAPSSKGLSMAPQQWRVLEENMQALSTALEGGEGEGVDLGGSKRAAPSQFKGRSTLDLREFYQTSAGELKPGKKGIALTPPQWHMLAEGAAAVTEQLRQKLGGSWPPAPAATTTAARSVPPGADASQEGAADLGVGGVADVAPQVDLGGSKRAEVSQYQGKAYLSMREFYQKEGKWLPGKKGISLPPDQAASLVKHAQQLGEALSGQDTSCEVQLSSKRKASISAFKGVYYVNIREYYEKDGQQLPGSKGISLSPDQWGKLSAMLPMLQQRLASLAGR